MCKYRNIGAIMSDSESEIYKRKAEILKAMAHPTRIMILEILRDTEKCVTDIHKQVGFDISTVSKHLAVMRNAGLLKTERKNKQIYYSVRVTCILNFFYCIEEVIKQDFVENTEMVKLCTLPKMQIDFSENAQIEKPKSKKLKSKKKSKR